MNRQQLIDAVAETVGDKKVASTAVGAVLDTVQRTVAAGEKVSLFGFGVFERVDRPARTARNPSTGGTVEVAASAAPRFRPGSAFRTTVNGDAPATPARSRSAAAAGTSGPTTAKTEKSVKSKKAEKPEKAKKADGGKGKKKTKK